MSQTLAPQQTGTQQLSSGGFVAPVSLGYYPAEGSKVCSLQYSWVSLGNYFEDLTKLKDFGMQTATQSIWVDNSENNTAVTIVIAGSNQQIVLPAYFQGVFPAFFLDDAAFFIASPAGYGLTKICLLNIPVNCASIWNTQSSTYTKQAPLTPVAGSQYGLNVTNATQLTVPAGANYATIVVEGGSVRYSSTGTPTATSGMLLQAGGPYSFSLSLSALTFIATAGNNTTIDVEYQK